MKGYFFLVDVGGSVRKMDDRGDTPFVSGDWFQLAKSGTFFSPVYGKVVITPADLATMLKNFKTITPIAPTQLPIDYDHLSDDPKEPGDAKAAGWVEDLQLRQNGTQLWCLPKWTKAAGKMIQDGEYRFVSPYFLTSYMDKASGKNVGPTLKAVAITNRPFLEGMEEIPAPAIAASDAAVRKFGMNKRVAVPVRQAIRANKAQGRIRMAEDMKEEMADKPVPPPGLTCPHCGAPVAHKGVATEMDDMDGDGDMDGDKMGEPVVDDKAPVSDPDADPLEMKDKGVEDMDVPEKKMSDQPVDKKDEKKDEMTPRERALADRLRALETKNTETERALKEIQQNRRRELSDTLIAKAVKDGKLTKAMIGTAEKPGWAMQESFRNPNKFADWLRNAPRVVEFGERGTSDEKAADGAANTAAKIDQLVGVKMSENKGLPYNDALKRVLSENSALADTYDREMIGERSPASTTRASSVRRL